MVHPNLIKDFIIRVDACMVPTAAILTQEQDDSEVVIGFMRKVLNSCKSRYTITEIEMLSIVLAVRKWRNLLFGHLVTVYTDHQPWYTTKELNSGITGSIGGVLSFRT